MVAREPGETHRAATPLELLFDLVFVVAIAVAAAELHHEISHDHLIDGLLSFSMAFLAIWWAWMGFTWFASEFDVDDAPYRLMVLVQMVGVVILASGIPAVFESTDFRLVTVGYAVMRVGLIALWVRAGWHPSAHRRSARRYALGLSLCQIGWISALALPSSLYVYAWLGLVVAELAVPAIAERAGEARWHPEHIAERYGLLTIIVVGESVLAATLALSPAIDAGSIDWELGVVIASAPPIFFGMWWLYFLLPHTLEQASRSAGFAWGYAHYFVFASCAAVGGSLAAWVDAVTDHSEASLATVSWSLSLPLVVFLGALWFVQRQCGSAAKGLGLAYVVGAVLLLLAPFTIKSPWPHAAVVIGLTAYGVLRHTPKAAE